MAREAPGILNIGTLALGAKKAGFFARAYAVLRQKFGEFSTDGGGYLTAAQSAQLAAALRSAIRSEGAGISGYSPRPLTDAYSLWKAKRGLNPGLYQATGSLIEAIKVLNLRYGAGGKSRRMAVGIDQRKSVPDLKNPSRKVLIAQYAHGIEFGNSRMEGRMLLTYATQDFLNRHGPHVTHGWFSKFMEDARAQMAHEVAAFDITDAKRDFGFASGVKQYTTSNLDAKSKADHLREFKSQYKHAMRHSGISAEELAHWEDVMKEVTG